MTRGIRKDVLTLVGIALAGSLLIASMIAKGPRPVPNPLVAIPTDAFAVITIDVRALAASPLGAALAGEKGSHAGAFFGVESIEATCGFDPLPHLTAIAISIPEGDTHGEMGIAASGDLTKAALTSCAKALIEKRGGHWSARESASYSIISEDRAHGAEVAFREGGPFLVGRGEWLEKMIDAAEGRSKSMALPNDDLQHSLRADLAASAPDANALIASIVLPRALRDRLGGELANDAHDGGDAPNNAMANVTMQGVLGVSGASLAIHAGRTHEDTRIVAELVCDGPSADAEAACAKVETLLLHERLKWSGDMRLRLFGLGALIDGLQTRVQGGKLTIQTRAPSDNLAHMIGRALDAPAPTSARQAPIKPDDLVRGAPPR